MYADHMEIYRIMRVNALWVSLGGVRGRLWWRLSSWSWLFLLTRVELILASDTFCTAYFDFIFIFFLFKVFLLWGFHIDCSKSKVCVFSILGKGGSVVWITKIRGVYCSISLGRFECWQFVVYYGRSETSRRVEGMCEDLKGWEQSFLCTLWFKFPLLFSGSGGIW